MAVGFVLAGAAGVVFVHLVAVGPAVPPHCVDTRAARMPTMSGGQLRGSFGAVGKEGIYSCQIGQVGSEGGNTGGKGDVRCDKLSEGCFFLHGGIGKIIQVAVQLGIGGWSEEGQHVGGDGMSSSHGLGAPLCK